MHKGEKEKGRGGGTVPIRLIRGGLIGLVITVVMAAVCAVLISARVLGEELLDPLAVLSCAVGAFGGGLTARGEKRSLLVGLLTGGLLFLILITVGVLAYDVTTPGRETVILALAAVCGGSLSGTVPPRRSAGGKKGEGRGRRKKR